MNDDLQSLFLFHDAKVSRVFLLTNLVALAATINVDGLELGLGGNGHGGLDLNAENFN